MNQENDSNEAKLIIKMNKNESNGPKLIIKKNQMD